MTHTNEGRKGQLTMDVQTTIRNVLVSTGRIGPKDRIEIIGKSGDPASNYARIEVHVFHGRRKIPYVYWNICVDMARELVLWDTSTFIYL